jgi:hypothetical protein
MRSKNAAMISIALSRWYSSSMGWADHTDILLQGCWECDTDIVLLVPDSTDQTQQLDLITFALLKQGYLSMLSRIATAQSNKLIRILGMWPVGRTPNYIIEAFANAGLIPVEREVFFLEVSRNADRGFMDCRRPRMP